jgi:hypothetical protein
LAGSKVTVAVICEVPVAQGDAGQNCTARGVAERETVMAAKVIVVEPVCGAGLAEVAVMVTWTLLGGGIAGAVYKTEALV